jgi:hypothetical protein
VLIHLVLAQAGTIPSGRQFLSAADWLIIATYLLGIIGLGVFFGKDQRNTRDYFLGSKNIPWWGIGFSIVAAETSALTIIGVPALAYGGNLLFIQMVIGYVIARIILAVVMVPHYFKGEIYSPYQLFANTFGPPARQTAGGLFLVSETLAAGVRVYVACIPIQLMLGIPDLSFILTSVASKLSFGPMPFSSVFFSQEVSSPCSTSRRCSAALLEASFRKRALPANFSSSIPNSRLQRHSTFGWESSAALSLRCHPTALNS